MDAILHVRGTFTYSHIQFKDEMNPVYLYLYLDRTFAPAHPAHIAVNPHEVHGVQPFELTGSVSNFYLPSTGASDELTPARLPADAKICAQCYVTSTTASGIPAKEDHGAATLDLRHVHADLVEEKGEHRGRHASQLQLAIHTDGNRVAGVLALTVEHMVIRTSAAKPVPIGFAAPTRMMNVEENVDALCGAVRQYTDCFTRERELFEEVADGTKLIVCPLDPEETTVLNSELMVPLVGFAMAETPTVEAGRWLQHLEIHADRQGFAPEEYAAHFQGLSLREQAAETVALQAQYVQQLTYVADKSDGHGIEMFGNALDTDVDDCDGLGKALLLMKRSFVGTDFAPHVTGSSVAVAATCARMQAIAREYVPLLCIEGVSSTDVENMQDIQRIRVNGAHFAIKFVPHPLFARYVANWRDDHPLGHAQHVAAHIASRYPVATRIDAAALAPLLGASHASVRRYGTNGATASVGAKGPLAMLQHAQRPVNPHKLPVLMGEGTGILYPIQGEDPLAEARAVLYRNDAMAIIKKPMITAPGPSEFYQVTLIAFTAEFVDTHRVGTFRFCTAAPELEAQGKYLRGVRFTDLMAKDETLRLVPFGFSQSASKATPSISVPIPVHLGVADEMGRPIRETRTFVPEFTREQLAMIHSVIKTRVPPRHFAASATPVLEYETRHAGLDRLCHVAGSPKAARINVASERQANRERTIHVYAQPEVADSQRWLSYMESHVRALKTQGAIRGLSYVREVHSETVARWRLSFRV